MTAVALPARSPYLPLALRLLKSAAALGAVCWAVGVWLSYTGAHSFASAAGYGDTRAWLFPVTLDAVALVAYVALLMLPAGSRGYPVFVLVATAGAGAAAQGYHQAALGGDLAGWAKFAAGAWPMVAALVAGHLVWMIVKRAVPAGLVSALRSLTDEPVPVAAPVAIPVAIPVGLPTELPAVSVPSYVPEIPERPEDATAVVYRFYGEESELLYVGVTVNPEVRMRSHRRRQPWWDEVAASEMMWFQSVERAADVEAEAIRSERPVYNVGLARYAHGATAAEVPQIEAPSRPQRRRVGPSRSRSSRCSPRWKRSPKPLALRAAEPLAPRVAAAAQPGLPKLTATTRRRTTRRPPRRPSRVPAPCVEGCDRHDGPVSYDTRKRCADRLAATA